MSLQQEPLDLGKLFVAQMHLKSGLSFAYDVSVDGEQTFAASGVWQRNGNELYWTYAYSTPELPQSAREDVDEILTVGQDQIVLKSSLTGKQRTMTRLPR